MLPSDSPDRRVAPAHAVPPAATDEIDAIVEAVSAGETPARGPDARRDTIAPSLASPAISRSTRRASMRSAAVRVVIPTLFAFLCGSLVAIWAVRLLERRAPIQPPGPGKEARAGDAASSLRAIPGRRAWSAMGPLATAPSRIAPVIRSQSDHRRAPVTPPPVAPSVAIANHPTPRANDTDRSGGAPPPAWSALANDVVPRGSTAIIGSLPLAETGPALPPTVPGGAAPAAAALGEEADAVRHTVARYEAALDQMNVNAAAAVFPSVDTLAMTRAFLGLKEQGVDFERCDVALQTATATVRCVGTAHYVVKVGTPTPRRRRYEWTFTLEKVGNAWKIGEVATTAIGRLLTQR